MRRLIADAPARFGLDLSGLRVLTEAASGPFAVTSLIAAMAGADEVLAVTRNSSYGTAADVRSQVMALAADLGVSSRIKVHAGSPSDVAPGCQIVTNLGFVRPIGVDVINALHACAAVALMWEPWEFRPGDIDVASLKARDIPLIGTCETHPLVATFQYVGALAGRLLFEAGIEIVNSDILVIGGDPFGSAVGQWLKGAGGKPHHRRTLAGADGSAPDGVSYDGAVVVEHRDHGMLLGTETLELVEQLGRSGAAVIRICGSVDRALLEGNGLRLYPDRDVAPGFMTVTTGYLGPRPVIDLHAAGLRAAQDVVRARLAGASSASAVEAAVASGFGLAMPSAGS